jgi:hypothetical protein
MQRKSIWMLEERIREEHQVNTILGDSKKDKVYFLIFECVDIVIES